MLSFKPIASVASRASVQRIVVCRASPDETARRSVIFAGIVPVLASFAAPAFALLPDEEDEELVQKAKAGRKAKLAEQKLTTRSFIQSEGLTDVQLKQEMLPVQRAVYALSKAGSELESGNVSGAAASLSTIGYEFEVASQRIGGEDTVKAKLADLREACARGDAQDSMQRAKKDYVELVSAIKSWAAATDMRSLKGL